MEANMYKIEEYFSSLSVISAHESVYYSRAIVHELVARLYRTGNF